MEAITYSNAVIVRRNKVITKLPEPDTSTTTNDRTGDFGIWLRLAPTDGDRSHDGLLPIPNSAQRSLPLRAERSLPRADALRGTEEFEQILPCRSVEQIAEPELR